MYKKLKSYLSDDSVFMALLLFGVAVASFGLGRMSVGSNETDQSRIALVSETKALPLATTTLNPATTTVRSLSAATSDTALYVGSKSGTKYHLTTCAGAKRIKTENKIYFKTTAEAEAAGYSKASNCPGL